MAQLAETVVVVKVSRLLRDNEPQVKETALIEQLEEVVQALAGEGALVEIITDE